MNCSVQSMKEIQLRSVAAAKIDWLMLLKPTLWEPGCSLTVTAVLQRGA